MTCLEKNVSGSKVTGTEKINEFSAQFKWASCVVLFLHFISWSIAHFIFLKMADHMRRVLQQYGLYSATNTSKLQKITPYYL